MVMFAKKGVLTIRTLMAAVFALISLGVCVRAQGDVVGTWSGMIEREGKIWRAVVSVEGSGDKHNAFVDFPDVDGYAREFSVTIKPGGSILLQRPQPSGVPITFEGVLAANDFTGDWSGFGQKAKFRLTRATKPARFYREQEVSFAN